MHFSFDCCIANTGEKCGPLEFFRVLLTFAQVQTMALSSEKGEVFLSDMNNAVKLDKNDVTIRECVQI